MRALYILKVHIQFIQCVGKIEEQQKMQEQTQSIYAYPSHWLDQLEQREKDAAHDLAVGEKKAANEKDALEKEKNEATAQIEKLASISIEK